MEDLQSITVIRVNHKGRYCISLVWAKTRYRFYNGASIGSYAKPNSLPETERKRAFNQLLEQFVKAIRLGWTPELNWSDRLCRPTMDKSILDVALKKKLSHGYSYHYERKLKWIVATLKESLGSNNPTPRLLANFINDNRWSPSMQNNLKRHILPLEHQMQTLGYKGTASTFIHKRKVEETLHKPIKNIGILLQEIEAFDTNLHLCAVLMYTCLLRPHREIRMLTWENFGDDFSYVALSGAMTKGKKNRIIPIQQSVREMLIKRKHEQANSANIFSGSNTPFSISYFNGLWTRFKKTSNNIERGVTLYSIRHTAAIHVYKNSGSLQTLQSVMGHSSMLVSLTYLRGLDIPTIKLNDLPDL